MDEERERLYQEIRGKVGNTPLVVIFDPDQTGRGNVILAKLESEAEWGGHYDRVYPELIYDYERRGRAKPGKTIILETSTGNAGISTAAIGTTLGYEVHLGVPASIDKARKDGIRELGGTVHEIKGDYGNAFPEFIGQFLATHENVLFLDHSRGRRRRSSRNNETTLKALEAIADEAVSQIGQVVPGDPRINYYIAGVGNGSTLLGPGRRFKQLSLTRVYGVEPFSSAVLFNLLHPGRYEWLYGIPFGSMPVHNIYGLSYPGLDFPHIRNSVGIVEDSILVGDREMMKIARLRIGSIEYTGPFNLFYELLQRYNPTQAKEILNRYLKVFEFPRLAIPGREIANIDKIAVSDNVHKKLNRILIQQGYNPVGRSSAFGLAAALELSKDVRNSTILFLCYDQLKRYDAQLQQIAA